MLRLVSIIVVLATVVLVVCLIRNYREESTNLNPGQNLVELNDYLKEALNFKREQMSALANSTILLIGGLWALIIGAKDRTQRLGWELWVVFWCANGFLGISYVLYLLATSQLIEYLSKAKTIDLYAPKVALYTHYQTLAFSIAIIYAVLFALFFYLRRQEAK